MLNVVTEVALHVHDVFFKKHLFSNLNSWSCLTRWDTTPCSSPEEKRKKRNLWKKSGPWLYPETQMVPKLLQDKQNSLEVFGI